VTPVEITPQVLSLRDVAEARAALARIRVSGAGIDIMEKKALFRVVRVRGLDVRAANILKQEMLSRGGEVATSREVYELKGGTADCLVMGTLTQFERLLPKLKQQPFGLRRLAAAIETALRDYDDLSPLGPPGLDLSDPPLLMGVLNVTPDSFSDGGSYAGPEDAIHAALTMMEEGAALVDVGGESTRPGADPLSEEEETARVLPVIEALAPSMQAAPVYGDVIGDLHAFFAERLDWAVANGLREENLLIDPGLGFGKTTAHNLTILRNLESFRCLGRPIVVGASRKRFLGEILGIEEASARDEATAVTTALAVNSGAHVVRVHRVDVNRDAARIARAVRGAVKDDNGGL